MTTTESIQPGGAFNPIPGLKDLRIRVKKVNQSGAAQAAVAEQSGGNPSPNEALQVSPLVRAGRRFHRAVLRTAALCLTASRKKEDIEEAILWADERIPVDNDGNPITSIVAFVIERGERNELIRGKLLGGVPEEFDVQTDTIQPIKTMNVRWVSEMDKDEIRGTKGAMQGHLLRPREKGKPWTFVAWGLAPEREIDILNQLFVQMGRSSQTVEVIYNDIHSPGLRFGEFTARYARAIDPKKGGGHIIGDVDGKIVILTQNSQQPPLGKVFVGWYTELEKVIVTTFAGWPNSIDMSLRPTVLQLGFGIDFEAVLGVQKEYLGLHKIDELREQLLDQVIETGHPAYDYLLSIGMFTEEDDFDFVSGQVTDAVNAAAKMAVEEMKHIANEASEAFAGLDIPSLKDILDGASIEDFRQATAGEDVLTKLIGAALEEPFDWDKPLHVKIRKDLIKRAVEQDTKRDETPKPEVVKLAEVLVNHVVKDGVKIKYDAVAMLGLHELTKTAIDTRVYDLTHGGDVSQIVAAYVTLGVTFDLGMRSQHERLMTVIDYLGKKVKESIAT